jgi:hypothetical protein
VPNNSRQKIGAPRQFSSPHLKRIRSWPIPGFERVVMFYVARADGMDGLRIRHSVRDLKRLFDA